MVYLQPKAKLHLPALSAEFTALGADLNVPTQDQADYTGVKVEGRSRVVTTVFNLRGSVKHVVDGSM